MSDPRPDKVAKVTEVREKLESAEAVLITEYRGLTVAELAELRGSMRSGGGEYKIYKNTFVRRAAAELNLDIGEHLFGPTALAFVQSTSEGEPADVATVAKALRDFAKGNPLLVVKGGVLGDQLLDAAAATALASLPTASEVYSRLAGAINSGARGIAGGLAGTHRSLAYALQAVIDGGHFAGDEPAEEEPEPAVEPEAVAEEPDPSASAEPAEAAEPETATETDSQDNEAEQPAPEMSTDDNTAADDAAEESE